MPKVDKEKSRLKCNECHKYFSALFNLRKHAKNFHPDKVNTIVPKKTYQYSCANCNRNFSHQRNLKEHLRTNHGLFGIVRKPGKHDCPLCTFRDTKAELSKHFKANHGIIIEEKNFNFNSLEEFMRWKKEIEQLTKSQYVKRRGCFNTKQQTLINYYCHRSGTFIPKGKSVRRLKLQGSNKINGFCPASMKVRIDKNKKCKVDYIDQHVGHDNDVKHLTLTLEERKSIAEKIEQRISFNDILKEAQLKSSNQRLNLLKKRDLFNIQKCFGLEQSEPQPEYRVENEGLDDGIFVEEVEVSTYNSDADDSVAQPIEENSDRNEIKENFSLETDHIYANLNCPIKTQIEIIDETLIVTKEKEKILTTLIPNLIKVVGNIFCMEQIEAFKKLCEPIVSTIAEIECKYEETQENNKLIQVQENII